MGSLDNWLNKLEGRMPGPEDESVARWRTSVIFLEVLTEASQLRTARGMTNSYRGGKLIQPHDPVGEAVGYPYTHGEAREFAVRRAIERMASEGRLLYDGDPEELIAEWTETFKDIDARGVEIRESKIMGGMAIWDEVSATGPPEPLIPRRLGGGVPPPKGWAAARDDGGEG